MDLQTVHNSHQRQETQQVAASREVAQVVAAAEAKSGPESLLLRGKLRQYASDMTPFPLPPSLPLTATIGLLGLTVFARWTPNKSSSLSRSSRSSTSSSSSSSSSKSLFPPDKFLHRSTSTTSFSSPSSSSSSSSSSSTTLVLHPLDIHFLGDPYGPPAPTPSTGHPHKESTPSGHPHPLHPPPSPCTASSPHPLTQMPTSSASENTKRPSSLWKNELPLATSLPPTPSSPPAPLSSLPKIQVCGRGGVWWALNAGVLLLYRDLHARGLCSSVRAETVPLFKVPEPLQRAMVLDGEDIPETDALLPGTPTPKPTPTPVSSCGRYDDILSNKISARLSD
ncbi:uncharacterized protein DDB_G0271670-like [Eriocheir sinensis]|uniref:uncharacterized protein DDB_G0271670-like n=1 Tax=Eriocheir sinensis TaxID=95602 RepID=UPI0021C568A7|nr:uncharacterized protein DDB_G0271670-like [Eriocheir sinensis]